VWTSIIVVVRAWSPVRWIWRLLPVPLCALAGHAVLFDSLFPTDGVHSYFGWYEPTIAALSLASLLVLCVLVLASLFGGESLRDEISRFVTPAADGRRMYQVDRTLLLVLASATFLFVQESIETSLAAGQFDPAFIPPGRLLLLLVALSVFAGVIARVEWWCRRLVARILGRAQASGRPARVVRVAPPERVVRSGRRRHPLADRRGLRAPPLPV